MQTLLSVTLLAGSLLVVQSVKQQIQLSDSYLPAAMQVIAHLTDQMAYEAKDDPTTPRPLYVNSDTFAFLDKNHSWRMRYGMSFSDQTTKHHKPGLFAPAAPPKPSERLDTKSQFVLLPIEHNSQYTIIEPKETKTEERLLSAHNDEIKPLMEPTPNGGHLLPPYEDKVSSRSDIDDEMNEDSLQYLSQNVRDMIKMARDPDDERLVDVWDGLRANPAEASPKGKLSSSNLRLLLLYDLLSREAKRQKLSDYSGFSPDVMKSLIESSNGGARAQLSMALSKMVERNDCAHEYANNRAKEMVAELGKDESKLSSELRYLQPLVYKY